MTFDFDKARGHFWRRAVSAFENQQDREDYVGECLLILAETGEKADVRIIAKNAFRHFFHKYRGADAKGRMIYEVHNLSDSAKRVRPERLSFADWIDQAVPRNPNDALASKPYALRFQGRRYLFDKHDLAELTGIKPASVQVKKNRRESIVVWRVGETLYPNINAAARSEHMRAMSIKKIAERVELQWTA